MKGEGESGAVLEAFLSLPSLSFFFIAFEVYFTARFREATSSIEFFTARKLCVLASSMKHSCNLVV
jgi:hypothetical protein